MVVDVGSYKTELRFTETGRTEVKKKVTAGVIRSPITRLGFLILLTAVHYFLIILLLQKVSDFFNTVESSNFVGLICNTFYYLVSSLRTINKQRQSLLS